MTKVIQQNPLQHIISQHGLIICYIKIRFGKGSTGNKGNKITLIQTLNKEWNDGPNSGNLNY